MEVLRQDHRVVAMMENLSCGRGTVSVGFSILLRDRYDIFT